MKQMSISAIEDNPSKNSSKNLSNTGIISVNEEQYNSLKTPIAIICADLSEVEMRMGDVGTMYFHI